MHDMVSIVLPTYNGERYLAQSIESCLRQTYRDLELIIVDDCSEDGTPEIIAGFERMDKRIKTIRNETNRKLPASLNIGFSEARGEYYSWTSDDNLYRPQAIEIMADILFNRPDVDIVYSTFTVVNAEGLTLAIKEAVPIEQIGFQRNIIGACFLFRRNVFSALHGYEESLFFAEDYDFWLRALCKFKFESLSEDLYIYRRHNDSLTLADRGKLYAATRKALLRQLSSPFDTQNTCAIRAGLYVHLTKIEIENGTASAARRFMLKALITAPRTVSKRTNFRIIGRSLLGTRTFNFFDYSVQVAGQIILIAWHIIRKVLR